MATTATAKIFMAVQSASGQFALIFVHLVLWVGESQPCIQKLLYTLYQVCQVFMSTPQKNSSTEPCSEKRVAYQTVRGAGFGPATLPTSRECSTN